MSPFDPTEIRATPYLVPLVPPLPIRLRRTGIRPNAQVPAHLLAVREVEFVLHRLMDITLAPAAVIHRYDP